jgi:heme A synthase
LGILTVLERKPADIASLHVAVGSLVLMTSCVILVRECAVLRASQIAMPAMAETGQE